LAAKAGCSHWIGAGSQAEYGVSNRKIDELAPTLPTTVYGQSKLAACLSTQKFCEAVGMNWSWLRVFSVYGPGDHPHWFIPYIIGELRAGRSPKLTKCEQVWDYLFIRDAAEAFIELARKQAGGIYNLGSGRTVSLRQVVEIISARLDSKTLPEFGAVPYRDDQVMHLEADIRRLTAATGWVPKTSIEIGLAETINVSNASP
jgi:nucleoside-diphosphate-sugar epimerase